jgi:group I intron endonuclease
MVIYRAINKINGKSYVGKTEKDLETRQQWHYASVRQKSQFAFHRALAKYGAESFDWEVLDLYSTDISELNKKEQYYIALYESFGPNGYNMTAGGEGQSGWVPSEETRKVWSAQRKGKTPWNKDIKTYRYTPVSEEQKEINQKNANQKRSDSLKGRVPWNNGKSGLYGYTKYKVIYKDGSIKEGTRIDLQLPKSTIDTMFRDKCGSRKYNIQKIERLT